MLGSVHTPHFSDFMQKTQKYVDCNMLFFFLSFDFANANINDEFLNKMNPHHVPDVVRFITTTHMHVNDVQGLCKFKGLLPDPSPTGPEILSGRVRVNV